MMKMIRHDTEKIQTWYREYINIPEKINMIQRRYRHDTENLKIECRVDIGLRLYNTEKYKKSINAE